MLSNRAGRARREDFSGQYPGQRKALYVPEIAPFPVGDAIFSMSRKPPGH